MAPGGGGSGYHDHSRSESQAGPVNSRAAGVEPAGAASPQTPCWGTGRPTMLLRFFAWRQTWSEMGIVRG